MNRAPVMPGGSPMNNPMLQNIMQFARNFQGNPKEAAMRLINSGQITQEQINQCMGIARQVEQAFGPMRR